MTKNKFNKFNKIFNIWVKCNLIIDNPNLSNKKKNKKLKKLLKKI